MLAAVDLGSNSFRLHVGQHDGRVIEVIRSAREPTRLAAGLESDGTLNPVAMQRGYEALQRLSEVLHGYPLEDVRVVATNTLRIATNAADFLSIAEKAIGFPIEVISGEEEARLIYMGIANQLATPGERRLVIDIGGGSTELILGRGQEIERAESIGIGTVWHSMNFFPDGRIDAAAFHAAVLYARSRFEDVFPQAQARSWKKVYGSSGTMRAIGEIITRNKIGSEDVSTQSLNVLKRVLIECGHIDRLRLDKLRPERAESVVGGLAILIGLMEALGINRLTPIEGGLRLGVLWDLHLRAHQRDRREISVRIFMQRFAADEIRGAKVAEYASALYVHLRPESEVHTKLLYWSALLYEIGLAVSPTNHHKHGAYLIENADLPGFTTREQRTMSKFILGQKGNLRKLNGVLIDLDVAKAVLALRVAVMFTQARVDVDFNDLRLKMKNRIELEIGSQLAMAHPTLQYWMEREQKFWAEIGIDFSIRSR